MDLKTYKILFYLFVVATSTLANRCSEDDTLYAVKKPVYDFSVRFLERVSIETGGHFVYSPLATWLQLVTIAEGAQGKTLQEIWNVTGLKGYRKKTCYRRKFRHILNDFEENVEIESKRKSLVVIDKFYKVKESFKNKVEELHSVDVVSADFDHPDKAVDEINANLQEINQEDNNIDAESHPSTFPFVDADDFDKSVVLMYDATSFKTAWKHAFNEAQTKLAPFYYDSPITVGSVYMMNQIGKFKEAEIPLINAKVLELPCADERLSMLIFLPLKGIVTDIYYLLKYISLSGVLNKLKMEEPKWINVSLPAFELHTEITNVIELLYDMGVKSAFYPETAELRHITDSGPISVSYMYQRALVQVSETHVTAAVETVENLVLDAAEDFNANKPFAFMLVDKKMELILFAGIYSKPDGGFADENDVLPANFDFNSKPKDHSIDILPANFDSNSKLKDHRLPILLNNFNLNSKPNDDSNEIQDESNLDLNTEPADDSNDKQDDTHDIPPENFDLNTKPKDSSNDIQDDSNNILPANVNLNTTPNDDDDNIYYDDDESLFK